MKNNLIRTAFSLFFVVCFSIFTSSLPKSPKEPKAGHAEIRHLELSPRLPHGWQGLMPSNHYLLPYRRHTSRMLAWKQRRWDIDQQPQGLVSVSQGS